MSTLTFATLNTWGTRGDWPSRLSALRDGFAALEADVLTLQETVLTANLDQATLMLGDGYYLAQQTERESGDRAVPAGQGITTASRWPIGDVMEVDLHVTDRTGEFGCACLVTEILAPDPIGRVWVANHFPDYQLDPEVERCLQAVRVSDLLEECVADRPGHVIVAGDMDADSASDSMRFWTGRHVIDRRSVCYRSAWDAIHPGEPVETYCPDNPFQVDPDWPFRGIDHVLVRCSRSGPTLLARRCRRIFDLDTTTASDHYGLVVSYEVAASTDAIPH